MATRFPNGAVLGPGRVLVVDRGHRDSLQPSTVSITFRATAMGAAGFDQHPPDPPDDPEYPDFETY